MGKLRHLLIFCTVFLLCALLPAVGQAKRNTQPPQPAVDNGRAWLLAHQNSDGSWAARARDSLSVRLDAFDARCALGAVGQEVELALIGGGLVIGKAYLKIIRRQQGGDPFRPLDDDDGVAAIDNFFQAKEGRLG